jgi:tRNA pseudouridine55 synthase
MDGLLVIDKPVGPTSHDVVARVRRALGERRIGHTGTLDPAASGVLPLVLGRATRLARFLSASDKAYDAVIRLGFSTDTQDADGDATGPAHRGAWPARETVDRALDPFRGTFLQHPPAFSAKKIDGQRSYRLARAASRTLRDREPIAAGDVPEPAVVQDRAGQESAAEVARRSPAAVSVTTHRIDVIGVEEDTVTLRVDCSAGFYVRALAHDLGQALGTGAHLMRLRRVRSGDVTLDDAIALDALERDPAIGVTAMVPIARMLPRLSAVRLTDAGLQHTLHGRDLGPEDVEGGAEGVARVRGDVPFFRLVDPAGDLVAIGNHAAASGLLHPAVVLV